MMKSFSYFISTLKLILSFNFLFLCAINSLEATPKIELDKQSCRWFYRPDNTYAINYQYDIYNMSTAGETLRNIQVNDNLNTTFGNGNRVISAGIFAIWTYNTVSGSAYPTGAWDWNYYNTTNWNGKTVTNMLNDAPSGDGETISNLTLMPGGVIHFEVCIIVKADNLPVGIGSNNSWTNTMAFVSAKSGNTNLTAGNIVNTQTPSITNQVTVTPYRNRSILTAGVRNNLPDPDNGYAALALDGTWSYDYFIRIQHHPNTVPNPDGATGPADNLSLNFDMWDLYTNNVAIKSFTITKEYGPSSLVPNPNYTGNASIINGMAVTPDQNIIASGGSLGVNEAALFKIHVVAGPSSNNLNNTMYFAARASFDDAGGVYQELASQQDTINDPLAQCNCWGWGIKLNYHKGIKVNKTIVDSKCSAGVVNKMDVEYEFKVEALSTNDVWLHNIQLLDNMNSSSCGSFDGIISPPTLVSTTATTVPALNATFDGNANPDLLAGSINDKLAPNENIVVRVKARYKTTAMCAPNQYNSATTVGTTPAADTTNYTVQNVLIPKLDCSAPPCGITVVSAVPSTCVPATSTYSVDVQVTYVNPPTGNITISTSNGATLSVAQTTSPQTITLTGLTADNVQNIAVTAAFANDNTCTNTLAAAYNAPASCACNLSATATGTNVSCNGGTNGSATVTPSGNLSAVTYLWSNSASTASITGLAAGTYTVTVTETASCTATASYTVTEPTSMSLTCSKVDVTTISGTNGEASVSATGGTSPYTYAWSNGASSASISGLTAGTYTVTVTDAKGCSDVCSSIIVEPGCNLSATATGTNVSCNSGANGTATVTPSGNLSAVTYLWSNGATTASITGLAAGTYTVTVTETASCTATASYTVTAPTALSLTCSKVDVTTTGGSNGEASVSASGGTTSYTYLWSNGATTSNITGLAVGTYTVTVTDANNCTSVCSSTVNEPGFVCNLTANAAVVSQPTCANNDGVVNLTVSGAVGLPTYLWSNGATTEDLTGLSSGDYTVTVTDGACTATATVSLAVVPMNIVYEICPGESYTLEVTNTSLTGLQWQKDGVDIPGAIGFIYTATSVGVYTYTSNTVGGCSVGQCCPIEVKLSANCCKPEICLPAKITRH